MNDKLGRNRRLKPRYSVNLTVEMFTKGLDHYVVERCANISLGGIFVCTDYKGEENEKIHLRVILKDKDAYFDLKSRVAWVSPGGDGQPKGFGVEFVELTEAQRHIIEHFLKDYVNVQPED